MKQLIVTADDFGLTPGVVTGIVEAHEQGIVTATSVMVNAPAAKEAFAWAREHNSLAVGLHFVLTFGRPVGPSWPLGDLIDDDGAFRRLDAGVHEHATPGRIGAELRAQLELFESRIGRPPTHIDGHHHVHAVPSILGAVVEAARRFHIPVRATDDRTHARLRSIGIPTPDNFVDTFYGKGNVGESELLTILDELPDGTSELMCHPAHEDSLLPSLSSYSEERYVECETLMAPAVREALAEREIELIASARS